MTSTDSIELLLRCALTELRRGRLEQCLDRLHKAVDQVGRLQALKIQTLIAASKRPYRESRTERV